MTLKSRFAPSPTGLLHIGNARTLILNDEYVKRYGGKLIIVMDDTIGSVEKPIEKEAYNLIEEGIKWLKVNYEKKVVYKSSRLKKYYAYAWELIRKGYMYVCECNREEMYNLRIKGIECSCRQFPREIQLQKWAEMFKAPEGSMCVRLKTSMQDKDPAFRDRVMFRISDRPHAKLGKKYRIYPLLDFSWAIDDHILGITHILRGVELAIVTRVEKFIWDIFKWEHPEIVYNGHFEVEGVKLSKSKGAAEVRSGKYSGWNDPKTWSLQSLKDRGILSEALREFMLNMGIRKTNVTIPIDILYALNKKLLRDVPRFFFVENPEEIKISGTPKLTAKIPYHPNGKLGNKEHKTSQKFLISKQDYDLMQNKNYRLMHLFNFKSDKLFPMRPREFSYLSKELDKKLSTKFLHWLSADIDNVKVKVLMSDGSIVEGLGEPELKNLLAGSIVQFERFGFVRLNKKEKDKLEFWFAHV